MSPWRPPSVRDVRRERGSVAVELAMGAPLLLLIVLAGVHFGKVLMIRHELADATSYATRAAVIGKHPDSDHIRAMIQDRLGAGSGCGNLLVSTQTATDAAGVSRLEVTARCAVSTGVGGGLLGALGPGELRVQVATPL